MDAATALIDLYKVARKEGLRGGRIEDWEGVEILGELPLVQGELIVGAERGEGIMGLWLRDYYVLGLLLDLPGQKTQVDGNVEIDRIIKLSGFGSRPGPLRGVGAKIIMFDLLTLVATGHTNCGKEQVFVEHFNYL